MAKEVTKRSENYSQWYDDLVVKADLAERSAVRGCMVIKPYGYAIWEKMQHILDRIESMFCSLIYVGEESGALDSILENASGYYEEEADTAVQNLVHLIEPVAIIFMGVVVCMVLMAVFPALYGSFENIQ